MTWFDGCNECYIYNDEITTCTELKCDAYTETECRKHYPTAEPYQILSAPLVMERYCFDKYVDCRLRGGYDPKDYCKHTCLYELHQEVVVHHEVVVQQELPLYEVREVLV